MTLNLNPLETNLVNLVIVIGLLFWFLRGFLGGILERRRAAWTAPPPRYVYTFVDRRIDFEAQS